LKDYQAQSEKLRKNAAECALIRDLAADKAKRELFDRLANHLTLLANQVEMAMIERKDGIEK
jgi:ribosomal protein S7